MNLTTNDEKLVLDLKLSAQETVLDIDLFEDDQILDISLYPNIIRTHMNVMVQTPHIDLTLEIGTVLCNGGEYPVYQGPYVAVPKVAEQEFETKYKSMIDNFTVLEIPYQEVSNPQGGETVIIAFE